MSGRDVSADWARYAACRSTDHEPDLWFPDGEGHRYEAQVTEAVAICAACPVRAACLDDAMRTEGASKAPYRYGIRGGLTPKDRADMYRRRQRATAAA